VQWLDFGDVQQGALSDLVAVTYRYDCLAERRDSKLDYRGGAELSPHDVLLHIAEEDKAREHHKNV
jgi:hypothetical protein